MKKVILSLLFAGSLSALLAQRHKTENVIIVK
ncbi:hypothetical protein HDF22_003189 [Mucilaginibacter lappiensis]|uniref:Uncharacterized protein n=1 Tax=Mucilaginibacter lappiensis TaxID=354630 RepID=A0A841JES4_9SPHI|nr:hypothetical protein [Mucilaginibacter lappiensis]